MGIWGPENFLIHVQGVIHAIKEMELDTNFQETMKAVKSSNLEVNLAKMTYKDKLTKGEKDDASVGADKAKKLKKVEGNESPWATVITAKAALKEAQKARNEVQE